MSSVFFGALTPKAPAINLDAVAVDFSGLFPSLSPVLAPEAASHLPAPAPDMALDMAYGDSKSLLKAPEGDEGVGGGTVECRAVGVEGCDSELESEEEASSSHDSAGSVLVAFFVMVAFLEEVEADVEVDAEVERVSLFVDDSTSGNIIRRRKIARE